MSYGSLTNKIYAGSKPGEPEVGGGATLIFWSDRHAATVTEISPSGHIVKVQADKVRFGPDGYAAEEDIERDPEGSVYVFTRRKNGGYVLKGDTGRSGVRAVFGTRRPYYDPSF